MVMGQTLATTEVLIIGGGPGGYQAAIRAAQLGFSVMLVDRAGELGGMCLHHGCIPSKSLIYAANLYYTAKNAEKCGITGELNLDFKKMHEWKDEVVHKLYEGILGLMKKHDIQVLKANAKFQNNTQVVLEGENLDVNAVEFRYCIVATGSKPRELPWAGFGGNIISSKEFLQLEELPRTLAVIGGGYIGIELGVMLTKCGSQVTVIEGTDKLLGVVDQELVSVAEERLHSLGITIKKNSKVEQMENTEHGVRVVAGGEELHVDKALVAIGHVPVIEGLQLDLAGIEVNEQGYIQVDEQCRTSKHNIYAIGDVTGGMMLAHKASAQGIVAAEAIAGKQSAFDAQVIPAVIFSDPEIATVGLSEEQARKEYGEIKTGKFPFAALGKALAITETKGFVKLVSDKNGLLLGVHAVGPHVTDYISEAALALEMGATAEDISLTIHPHPTLAESLSEAADVLMGQAIHIYQPKKRTS